MDLINIDPLLNMYDQAWPIRTYQPILPPPKFVFSQTNEPEPRVGTAMDSMISAGCIISGGQVERSVLSQNVRVNSYAHVQDSILFSDVNVGRRSRIRNAIIDKGFNIPEGMEIGYDLETDRSRGFHVTDSGIVVIGKVNGMN